VIRARTLLPLVACMAAVLAPAVVVSAQAVPPVPPTAPPAAPTTGPGGLAFSGPSLRQGAGGQEVALFQIRLVERGFWIGDRLGSFGDSTTHAVVAFQKYLGLPRSGVIDGWTRIALAAGTDRMGPRTPRADHSIDVDLGRQILIIQTGGRVDWIFDISSGKRSTPTPRGQFTLQRQIRGVQHAKLGVLYSPKYFTGGYAIHGSPSVPNYPASHGCVRLTIAAINFLWSSGQANLGTPISIH
jgi:lipoprotein-anchoring transpeptidase ErfK/SrfK